MKYLIGALIMLVILVAALLIYIYSGAYDLSTSSPHNKVTLWVIRTLTDHSINNYSKSDMKVPNLSDSSLIKMGFDHYREMCVECHGAPGVDRDDIGKGLYPRGPNLARSIRDLNDQQLFWIIKNGIKMTGMPGFGNTHSDDRVWAMVAFTKTLPKLTPEQYQKLDKEVIKDEE